MAINAVLLSYALDVYVNTSGTSLLWICSISIILFTVISLLLVNGFNEKTYAAIVATLLGTFVSLLITYLVMWITSEKGLRYEEMQFVTSPYRMVFMAGLFVGSLGAVMDVAIKSECLLLFLDYMKKITYLALPVSKHLTSLGLNTGISSPQGDLLVGYRYSHLVISLYIYRKYPFYNYSLNGHYGNDDCIQNRLTLFYCYYIRRCFVPFQLDYPSLLHPTSPYIQVD